MEGRILCILVSSTRPTTSFHKIFTTPLPESQEISFQGRENEERRRKERDSNKDGAQRTATFLHGSTSFHFHLHFKYNTTAFRSPLQNTQRHPPTHPALNGRRIASPPYRLGTAIRQRNAPPILRRHFLLTPTFNLAPSIRRLHLSRFLRTRREITSPGHA